MSSSIHNLDDDSLKCVLGFLDPLDLVGSRVVCTRWKKEVESVRLWHVIQNIKMQTPRILFSEKILGRAYLNGSRVILTYPEFGKKEKPIGIYNLESKDRWEIDIQGFSQDNQHYFDERFLVTRNNSSNSLSVWDLVVKERVLTESGVLSASYHDKKLLLTTGGHLKIWDAMTCQWIVDFQIDNPLQKYDFTVRGDLLLIYGDKIIGWDLKKGEKKYEKEVPEKPSDGLTPYVKVPNDEMFLLATPYKGQVHVFNLKTGESLFKMETRHLLSRTDFHCDGEIAVISPKDESNTLQLWNLKEGKPSDPDIAPKGEIFGEFLISHHRLIAFSKSIDKGPMYLKIWNIEDEKLLRSSNVGYESEFLGFFEGPILGIRVYDGEKRQYLTEFIDVISGKRIGSKVGQGKFVDAAKGKIEINNRETCSIEFEDYTAPPAPTVTPSQVDTETESGKGEKATD
jgi:hypothetical protein